MKQYLEIIEQLTEEEMFIKQPQIVRIEVVNKEEAVAKLPDYEPSFIGRTYTKNLHKCYHEEGQSCVLESLEKEKIEPKKI